MKDLTQTKEEQMLTPAQLDDRLTAPRPALVEDLSRLDGDLLVIGAGGKLGPSLVRLAVRALEAAGSDSRVLAVSRFATAEARAAAEATGAVVIPADVTDDGQLTGLPEAANVVFLVGAKFGSSGQEAATWATNTYLPGRVAQRYAGSRLVGLSTGNVYPFTPVASGGATEATAPQPVGDYAMSCLGRERILTHVSEATSTPTALIRLNYAVEMRYGVLVDLARMIRSGQPVDVTMGAANVVWQGYANEVILRSLLHASVPPFVLNLTGPETISIRRTAERLAERMHLPVEFTGAESPTALLSDASRCHGLFGYPDTTLDELVDLTAEWVLAGGTVHEKPTKFQQRDGKF
ncbi:epimerase [Promicromonospora sp. NPDC023987]|uniref:NAD-dependent epimerase/dehydratase family protein n=1 Tax=Promicromonospora sp. NPDC023987 TaxID=3155360 RepID=UPI0033C1D5C8